MAEKKLTILAEAIGSTYLKWNSNFLDESSFECLYCGKACPDRYDEERIEHDSDCPVLLAKDILQPGDEIKADRLEKLGRQQRIMEDTINKYYTDLEAAILFGDDKAGADAIRNIIDCDVIEHVKKEFCRK